WADSHITAGQTLDLLDEGLLRTLAVEADEPPHPQHDLHPAACSRHVGQAPHIPTMNAGRVRPAAWTCCGYCSRVRLDQHGRFIKANSVYLHITQVREEKLGKVHKGYIELSNNFHHNFCARASSAVRQRGELRLWHKSCD